MCHPQFRSQLSAACALVLCAAVASAQPPTTYPAPLLKTVFPVGGRAGTTVEVTLAGSDLDDATELYFSTSEVKAERVPAPPADPKKKNAPPPKFKVTIPPDTPVGTHDVRVVGKWGVSNPRAFVIGALPEIEEKEPNSDVPEANTIELGSVANGVIASKTDVDYFVFAGKKGQQVVAHCAASAVDSRLTAHLQLFTADGRELGSNRFYRDRDALLSAELPADGGYYARVCDFAYLNGGPEYPYRLTVTAGPWVEAAFPPAVPAGKATAVALYGWNLPGGEAVPGTKGRQKLTVTVNAAGKSAPFPGRALPRLGTTDGFAYQFRGANPVWLALADAPVVLDSGDNNDATKTQPLTVPCDVCGKFEARLDRDYYAFEAKKGDVVVTEGFSDRLRAAGDLYFTLLRARDGQSLGEFDTHPDVPQSAERFFTHTADPLARFSAPEDGTYHLVVRSRDAVSGTNPRDVYRVSLRRERPDFRLVLVGNHDNGAGLTVRRGASQSVQVVCFRQDGFDGEVTLAAEGLPPGVTCEPQVIGPNVKSGALVLTATDGAKDWAGAFQVRGTAVVGGKKVTRDAVAGCLVFAPGNNNNVPAVSRLSRSLCLAVREPGPVRLVAAQKELAVPAGGTAVVKVKVDAQRPDMKDQVSVTLAAGPAQSNGRPVNIGAVNIAPAKQADVRVQIPSRTPPGRYTLVFRGSAKYALDDPKTKKKRNTQYATVAAPVALTVYSSACELDLGPGAVTVGPGGAVAVPVTVKRLYGYTGPITLELVAPSGPSGVSAANVTLPEGATQTKLVLKAAGNAKPTPEREYLVRATAKSDNVTLREEAKLRVTIGATVEPKAKEKSSDLLAAGAKGWRYTDAVKGDGWMKAEFDDKGWKEAQTPLGYGETEIGTRKGTEIAAKGVPIYCRRAFDVPAELLKQKGAAFRLKVASDNSAAVYLNGKAADADTGDHEFSYWNRDVVIPAELLKPGRNVIAARVDNAAGSSDAYLDLCVTVEALAPEKK